MKKEEMIEEELRWELRRESKKETRTECFVLFCFGNEYELLERKNG